MAYRNQPSSNPTPSYIQEGLGELVQRFTPRSIPSRAAKITDVETVASYSWIDAPKPTLAVPGSPGIWRNVNPQRVAQDSGLVCIDQNSYRMKNIGSPLAPLFAAIDDLGAYDFTGLDFVSDRNNLRKLFRWSQGVSSEDFRIDVELAGQTCLFTRRDEKDAETITGFRGFGREYEKATTRLPPGCERATSHHRIISMRFGDIKILLRFEVDACTGDTDDDDLSAALTNLSIGNDAAPAQTSTRLPIPGLTVIRTSPRTVVPQSSLIELKTRVSHRPLDWAEVYPQLYLSQTTYLYFAKHTRGVFAPAEKFSLQGSNLAFYAKQAEDGMGKLKFVLSEVLAAVREAGSGMGLCLICVRGQLALYKRKEGTGKAVDKEILRRFA